MRGHGLRMGVLTCDRAGEEIPPQGGQICDDIARGAVDDLQDSPIRRRVLPIVGSAGCFDSGLEFDGGFVESEGLGAQSSDSEPGQRIPGIGGARGLVGDFGLRGMALIRLRVSDRHLVEGVARLQCGGLTIACERFRRFIRVPVSVAEEFQEIGGLGAQGDGPCGFVSGGFIPSTTAEGGDELASQFRVAGVFCNCFPERHDQVRGIAGTAEAIDQQVGRLIYQAAGRMLAR